MEVSTFIRTSAAAVIGLSLASTAAGQILLNSFEDTPVLNSSGDRLSFEGTALAPARFILGNSNANVANAQQVAAPGVTDGAFAGSGQPQQSFTNFVQLDLFTPVAAQLAAGGAFAIDVYGTVAPGDDGFGIQFATLTENGNDLLPGGGDDYGNYTIINDAISGDNFFFVADATQTTVTVNLPAYNTSVLNSPGSVAILFVIVNNDTPSTVVLDNARIVPEPATAALLGLGALAGLRRRR